MSRERRDDNAIRAALIAITAAVDAYHECGMANEAIWDGLASGTNLARDAFDLSSRLSLLETELQEARENRRRSEPEAPADPIPETR